MKFIIVLSCLFALAFANYETEVLTQSSDVGPESFNINLELGDKTHAQQAGVLNGDSLKQTGSFGWISPEGVPVEISYVADENGYQPKGDVLPHN